ncbi:alpha/beta-hydrolase [Coprinopsis marcescibilis]|uniref:Alpha/beta-hydrolase n=1 Tax=Coprinopsis marcescibilis TaxID=230819 RepID=A0A5C3KEV0_COPMA|nr:alpha/beta-hydrolase [Coprinopsis marcescibilis]
MATLLRYLALASVCFTTLAATVTSSLTMEQLYRSQKYKETTVSRGFTYRYYFSPATQGKPTLVFVHGFPSFSAHWIHQITFFEEQGYGLVVPDMLGYGGTSIPQEPEAYVHPLQAKDLVDILDAENVGSDVVAIGHDLGSITVSRVANIYPERFLGFAFLSVGYVTPDTVTTYQQQKTAWARELGYVNLGYWEFFSAPGTDEVIVKHNQSFFDLAWSRDPKMWKYGWGPDGAFETFIKSDSSTPRATYISSEDMKTTEDVFAKGGWNGPLSYYKNEVSNVSSEADKVIPIENYVIDKPVLFIATGNDAIIVPKLFSARVLEYCPQSTTKILSTGHWAFWEAPDQLNSYLLDWLVEGL